MKYMVAPSYKNASIVEINEETKKAYIKITCDRCGGRGIVASRIENGKIIPIPVDEGICYITDPLYFLCRICYHN